MSKLGQANVKDNGSIASSIGVGSNAPKQVKIKRYCLMFGKGVKIINLRDILLLSFYFAVLSVVTFILFDQEQTSKWKSSRTLFSVYSTLSRMDLEFRGALQIIVERFVFTNTLIRAEAWAPIYPPATRLRFAQTSLLADRTAREVLGTDDIVGFLVNDVRAKKLSLSYAINDFKTNERLSDLRTDIRSSILRQRIDVVEYNQFTGVAISSTKQSDLTFLASFKVTMEQIEEMFVLLGKTMAGKTPPYGFGFIFLLNNFGNPSGARFSVLKNAWSGSMDFHNATLQNIKMLCLEDQPKRTERNLLIYTLVSGGMYIIFLVGCLIVIRSMSVSLLDILMQYRNLKYEEIELHKLLIKTRILFFSRFKLDEPAMITNYMRRIYSFTQGERELIHAVTKRNNVSKTKNSSIRRKKLKPKITLKSVWTFGLVAISSILLIIYLSSISLKVSQKFNSLYTKLKLYTIT